jgi:ABC-type antimicrobial peptide transport system permease subunit
VVPTAIAVATIALQLLRKIILKYWPLIWSQNIYRLLVTPRLVATGIGWALALALAGSLLLPAIRAGRLQVIQALRAT